MAFPAGSVPLLEVAKYTGDPLTVAYAETIIAETNILAKLPWQAISGEAVKHEEELTLPEPAFRAINETYTPTFGTDREHFWGTATMGSEVVIDNKLVRQYGEAGAKQRQYRKHAKATAFKLMKTIIDGLGTVAAKDFMGLNALIDAGYGQIVYGDGAGSAEAEVTFEMFDSAVDELRTGDPDDIWLNRQVRTNLTQLARTMGSGHNWINQDRDMFGKKIVTWMDIPLSIVGQDHTGAFILDFDETVGSDLTCTSVYFIRYGVEHVSGLMGQGGSFSVRDFGEAEAYPGHLGRTELYPGLMVANQYSVVRLAGLILNDFAA